MRHIILTFCTVLFLFGCKEQAKPKELQIETVLEDTLQVSSKHNTIAKDTVLEHDNSKAFETKKSIKAALEEKGFKTYYKIDETSQDTIIMQQYFMAFFKEGIIRGQNEENEEYLRKAHVKYLDSLHVLGYIDISGPLPNHKDFRDVTIYNVPTLQIADSLTQLDPMVKAGHLDVDIYPWWATKGSHLR